MWGFSLGYDGAGLVQSKLRKTVMTFIAIIIVTKTTIPIMAVILLAEHYDTSQLSEGTEVLNPKIMGNHISV
jgi:hypothetical protein